MCDAGFPGDGAPRAVSLSVGSGIAYAKLVFLVTMLHASVGHDIGMCNAGFSGGDAIHSGSGLCKAVVATLHRATSRPVCGQWHVQKLALLVIVLLMQLLAVGGVC